MQDVQGQLAQNPVIVLGPGMNRIAYDEGAGWLEIEERFARAQKRGTEISAAHLPKAGEADDSEDGEDADPIAKFLAAIFNSRRSVPRTDADLAGPRGEASVFETVRAAVVAEAAIACFVATKCLFLEGQSSLPTTSWNLVTSYRRVPARRPASGEEWDTAEAQWIDQLDRSLGRLQMLVEGIRAAHETPTLAIRVPESPDLHPSDDERRRLHFMAQPDSLGLIVAALKDRLNAHPDKPEPSVDADMIEWLADLLWLMATFDSKVPMSESELRFAVIYFAVTPSDRSETQSQIRRPNRREHRPKSADLADFWQLRYASGNYGFEDAASHAEFIRTPRGTTFRKLAASLHETWKANPWQDDPMHLPLVLDQNYDHSIERALWESGRPGESFHVVIPRFSVEGASSASPLEITTITVPDEPEASFASALHDSRWSDIDENDGGPQLCGPVVVKLNGSPRVRGRDIVYSQSDAMYAVLSFPKISTGDNAQGIADSLARAASWSNRNWLFLGVSFPDWIARLQVAERRLGSPQGRGGGFGFGSQRRAERGVPLAVDLEFEDSERDILDTFEIKPVESDLRWIAEYFPGDPDPASSPLLSAVKNRLEEQSA